LLSRSHNQKITLLFATRSQHAENTRPTANALEKRNANRNKPRELKIAKTLVDFAPIKVPFTSKNDTEKWKEKTF
jgi:hypothetical protein